MRNLKRALSLALASVMVMGMMVVGTSAAGYKDVSSEQNQEAIEVLQAVGIMVGDENGNFNPDANVTRNEMAVIMSNLLNLDYDYYRGVNKFSDVPAWAAPYVAACAAEGVTSGIGGTLYGGSNNVTAAQAALMLMKALGYFQYAEDFGDDWTVATVRQASYIALFDGVKANAETPLTRNQVAQMVLNALESDMVYFTGDAGSKITVNGVEFNASYRAEYSSRTSTDKKYNTLKSGKTDISDQGQYYIQLGEELYDGDLTKKDDTDAFMRPATTWKLDAKVIGTYADDPDLTYTKGVKASAIYKDLGLTNTVPQGDVTVYINGEEVEDAALAIKKDNDTKIGKKVFTDTYGSAWGTDGNGVLTEVYYDQDEDTITIVQVITYVGEIAKTVKATSTRDAYVVIDKKTNGTDGGNYFAQPKDAKGNSAGKLEFETDETFADDTYVLYTYSFDEDEVMSVIPAEKVEGYVTKTINKTEDSDKNNGMTIDGTEYKMSLANAGEALGNVSVKKDYTVYLDQYGYIIYVEEIEEIGDYALLLATAERSNFIGNKAQLLLTDGTIKFVTTDENYNAGDKKIEENTIVTFRENKDGEYTLKEVKNNGGTQSNENDQTTFAMINDKAGIVIEVVDGKKTIVNANSATVFVVSDQNDYDDDYTNIDDWTAYTGIKSAPTVKADTGDDKDVSVFYYCKDKGMATVMFVIPNTDAEVSDQNKDMIFLAGGSVSDLIHDEDGNYYEYNAVVDKEIVTVKVEEDTKVGGKNAYELDGLYSGYNTNKYDMITKLTQYAAYDDDNQDDKICAITGEDVAVGIDKTSKKYTVILDTAGSEITKTVDDDAKIYYVDEDDKISEITYDEISVDNNDKVYAVIEDYQIQTLVIYAEKEDSVSYGVKVTATGDATVKVGNKTVAAGKSVEYDKNDEDVVITVTPKDGYEIKSVKVDGSVVTLDKNNQYTIAKIRTVHTVEVATKTVQAATMSIAVEYVDKDGVVIESNRAQKMSADEGEDSVAVTASVPAGYKLVGAKTQYVPFEANKSVTVTFTVEARTSTTTVETSAELATAIENGASVIYLDEGSFELDYTKFESDITLIGVPGETTVKTGKSAAGRALEVAPGVKLTISGIDFVDGDSTKVGIKQTGGESDPTVSFDISDCSFTGYETAIQLFYASSGSITDCTFDSKLVDISLNGVSGKVTISGNTYSTNNTMENIGIVAADKDKIDIQDTTNVKVW